MSHALRQLIHELRRGAEMAPAGGNVIQWRHNIKNLPAITTAAHGAGVAMMASAARTLLLQRGQVGEQSELELRGVLAAIANILDMELAEIDARGANRQTQRRAIPYHLRDST